MEIRFMFVSNQ